MDMERHAIAKAIENSSSITNAARILGASRRTLQKRMRDYDMPEGQAGRPRELLPYNNVGGDDEIFGAIALLAVGGLVWAWWTSKERVGEDGKSRDLRGLDLICTS